MKKTGFTLAEVLVTLSIIGVVAAVTLPSINANAKKAQLGPILAKAVNTIENANRLALQEYETSSLETAANCINSDRSNYITVLERYVAGANNGSGGGRITGKDGVSFEHLGVSVNGTSTLTNKYHNKAYVLIIDTNSYGRPNIQGEDQFKVLVDYAGTVIPCGSQEEYRYNGNTVKTDCKDNPTEACIGNIADNGWKVIY